ncbi:hypothetical protein BU23DRAFT_543274 [Bimuria novae-zelandiae CBS 107.79]|uniref:IEC3 subunit of the Ino80 complex, chromatin re-modelling-domain-containing protein n=1 Tax=Bimuria novae-zelandiae CBS 107.79 TaxID=1447943 RepID=A0A6A5UW17_9PLEO|nr:hypothetical protein BU23DRAFT_543274 [Bimuria novae-zelandiae CBS 107.79]
MASPGDAHADAQLQPDAHHEHAQEKPPVKRSWRRKYRKMRARFEDTMTASNSLILEEWKAQATARRLREHNDQILDILLDMNDSARLPARLRLDLREQAEIDAQPTIEDPEVVHQRLLSLRTELANGIISAEEYARRAEDLHNSQTIQLSRSLAALEAKVPHTTDAPEPPIDGIDLTENAPGYMSPAHEEEYLALIDASIAEPAIPETHPIRMPAIHVPPTEKDLTVRNPDSVYNWLRKHQPQVFLQDKDPQHPENMSEKAAPRANAGRGKRQSAAAGTPGPKTDHEEDDGFDPEAGAGAKGGRKSKGGENDSAYRPKGGSSRAPKRKREDGETPAKGGKRKRASAGVAA